VCVTEQLCVRVCAGLSSGQPLLMSEDSVVPLNLTTSHVVSEEEEFQRLLNIPTGTHCTAGVLLVCTVHWFTACVCSHAVHMSMVVPDSLTACCCAATLPCCLAYGMTQVC
jgi:hypothetical protein